VPLSSRATRGTRGARFVDHPGVTDGVPDPTTLYRVRDGVYAADLLIAAVVGFDLFTHLARVGPVTADRVCTALGWARRPADVVLTLAAAHGLVRRDVDADDLVTVTDLAARHLVAGSPYDLRAYYASLAERPAVREFVTVLRTDTPASWASAPAARTAADDPDGPGPAGDWSGRLGDVGFARRITAAMDARGAFLGPALAQAVDDLPGRRVLDVGGRSGVYAAALLDRRPGARAAVLERPPVDTAARTLLGERGLDDVVDVLTGDMFTDPFPRGFDVHLFSQVLHDWDAERVEHLLAASFAALTPGGVLLDHDAHVDADRSGPLPVAEYSALLVHSTAGKCWSVGELSAMASRVGFVDLEHRPTVADRSVLVARRPRR